MQLRRCEAHQCSDANYIARPFQPSSKPYRKQQRKYAEQRRYVAQSAQGIVSEQRLPGVGEKNIQKTHWRQNRCGQCFLPLDIVIDNVRVSGEADASKVINVASVEIFIYSQFDAFRLRMQPGNGAECRRVKKRWWQSQKNSDQ